MRSRSLTGKKQLRPILIVLQIALEMSLIGPASLNSHHSATLSEAALSSPIITCSICLRTSLCGLHICFLHLPIYLTSQNHHGTFSNRRSAKPKQQPPIWLWQPNAELESAIPVLVKMLNVKSAWRSFIPVLSTFPGVQSLFPSRTRSQGVSVSGHSSVKGCSCGLVSQSTVIFRTAESRLSTSGAYRRRHGYQPLG